MKRTAYFREWHRQHPGYKAMQWRKKAIFRPSRKPRYRELLGIRVRVNLLGTLQSKGDGQ